MFAISSLKWDLESNINLIWNTMWGPKIGKLAYDQNKKYIYSNSIYNLNLVYKPTNIN